MSGIKAKRKRLVRKTLMRAKTQGERAAEQRQELPEEYAQTEVQQGISDVAARTGNTAKSTARISYRKFRAMQEKRKNLTLQGSTQSAPKPTEKEKVTVPTQTERLSLIHILFALLPKAFVYLTKSAPPTKTFGGFIRHVL